MNDDQFDDLKQFIDSRISQSEKRFDQKLDQEIGQVREEIGQVREEIGQVREEMLDGFAGVAEAVEGINVRAAKTDQQLVKLHRPAA